MLKKKGFCDSFWHTYLSKILLEQVGFAFIDHADLIQSGEDPDEVLDKK